MNEMTDKSEEPAAFQQPKCRYCGAAISAHQMLHPGHCGQEPCKLAHITHGIDQQKKQRANEYSDRQAIARARGAVAEAAALHGCSTDELLVAVVPFQDSPLIPLPIERKEAFIEHLNSIITAAFAVPDDTAILVGYQHSSDPEPSIVDAGCAACQGHCCIKGGSTKKAYLTRQTVYYLLDKTPEWDAETFASAYINALPEVSVEDSCVYHGPNGCTLGRGLRAAICNSFYCHDLYALHDLTGGQADLPLLIVGIDESEVGNSVAGGADQGFQLLSPKSKTEEPASEPRS